MHDGNLDQKVQVFKYGFSLLENVTVIAILILLIGVGGVYYLASYERSKEKACQVNLTIINAAAVRFEIEQGHYPESLKQLMDQGYLEQNQELIEHPCRAGGQYRISSGPNGKKHFTCSIHDG